MKYNYGKVEVFLFLVIFKFAAGEVVDHHVSFRLKLKNIKNQAFKMYAFLYYNICKTEVDIFFLP